MRKLALLLASVFSLSLLLCSCTPKTDELLDGLKTGSAQTSSAQTSSATSDSGASSTDTSSDFSFAPSDYLEENGHFKSVTALDYVTLPDYKNISVPADVHTPSDADVQEQIDSLLKELASPEHLTDVTVQDGDTVNIDYVGYIDEVAFENGSTKGQGTTVTIGVTTYIDDFLQQLIGHKPGETFNVEVTFPDDYGNTALNGKNAVFVTTINYVEGAELIPSLTDELVSENFSAYGWTNIAEMNEGIRKGLSESAVSDYLETYLKNNSKIANLPDCIMEFQENSILDRYNSYATYYQVSLDEILSSIGFDSREAFLKDAHDDLRAGGEYYLIIQAIAEQEGMTFTADDLAAYFEDSTGSADYSTYEEEYGIGYLYFVLSNTKVLDMITDSAVME